MAGSYCRLEPLDPLQHWENLFYHFKDDRRCWTYLFDGPFETAEDFLSWLYQNRLEADPQFYVIIRQSDHAVIGMASYLRIYPDRGAIEVGNILFSDVLKRTPIATEAMFLMMSRAFALGYRRYEWKCDALNAASRSAARGSAIPFDSPSVNDVEKF